MYIFCASLFPGKRIPLHISFSQRPTYTTVHRSTMFVDLFYFLLDVYLAFEPRIFQKLLYLHKVGVRLCTTTLSRNHFELRIFWKSLYLYEVGVRLCTHHSLQNSFVGMHWVCCYCISMAFPFGHILGRKSILEI